MKNKIVYVLLDKARETDEVAPLLIADKEMTTMEEIGPYLDLEDEGQGQEELDRLFETGELYWDTAFVYDPNYKGGPLS